MDRHNTFAYATYGQDSSLWLIDNGIESIDIVHSQVANRESTIAYILWSQLSVLRLCCQLSAPVSNLLQAEGIRLVNDRDNQSFLNGYCNPYMYFLLQGYLVLVPRRIETGMHSQRRRCDFHQQVGVAYFFDGPLQDLLTPGDQPACIDLAHKVKVRYTRPTLCCTLRHNAPGITQGQLVSSSHRRFCCRNGLCHFFCGKRCLYNCRQHVCRHHCSTWSSTFNRCQLFPLLGCQSSRLGRGHHQARGSFGRRGFVLVLQVRQYISLLNTLACRFHLA